MNISTLTMFAVALACPPETQAQPGPPVTVIAEHHAPAISSTYTLDELRAFAARVGHAGRHPVMGFYLGTFGYTLEPAGCPAKFVIRLILHGRVVGVPSDAVDWGCKPEALASHYLVYAKADDSALSQLARQLQAVIDEEAAQGGPPVPTTLASTVERLLPAYEAARAAALAASDDEPELGRVRAACRNGGPGAL